jgi:hypothetical protein
MTRNEQAEADAAMSDEEYRLRKYIAISHQDGKCSIYGDDGELQCSNLFRHGRTIDFRREPINDLLDVIESTRWREWAEANRKPPEAAKPSAGVPLCVRCGKREAGHAEDHDFLAEAGETERGRRWKCLSCGMVADHERGIYHLKHGECGPVVEEGEAK